MYQSIPTVEKNSAAVSIRNSLKIFHRDCLKQNSHVIHIYLIFSRDSKLQENVLLGSGTTIDSNAVISHSVIGRNCKIGMWKLVLYVCVTDRFKEVNASFYVLICEYVFM